MKKSAKVVPMIIAGAMVLESSIPASVVMAEEADESEEGIKEGEGTRKDTEGEEDTDSGEDAGKDSGENTGDDSKKAKIEVSDIKFSGKDFGDTIKLDDNLFCVKNKPTFVIDLSAVKAKGYEISKVTMDGATSDCVEVSDSVYECTRDSKKFTLLGGYIEIAFTDGTTYSVMIKDVAALNGELTFLFGDSLSRVVFFDEENPELAECKLTLGGSSEEENLLNEDSCVRYSKDGNAMLLFKVSDDLDDCGVNPSVQVSVNDGDVKPDTENVNSYSIPLGHGENIVKIAIIDQAKRRVDITKTITIFNEKDLYTCSVLPFHRYYSPENATYIKGDLKNGTDLLKYNYYKYLTNTEKASFKPVKINSNIRYSNYTISDEGILNLKERTSGYITIESNDSEGIGITELSNNELSSNNYIDAQMPFVYTSISGGSDKSDFTVPDVLSKQDTISMKVDDDSPVVSVNMQVNGEELLSYEYGKGTEYTELPIISMGEESLFCNGKTIKGVDEYKYTATLTVTDIVGNEYASTREFVVDTVPPEVTVKGGLNCNSSGVDNGELYVTKNSSVSGISVSDDLSDIDNIKLVYIDDEGNESKTTIRNFATVNLNKGNGKYYIEATDTRGNTGRVALSKLLGIDDVTSDYIHVNFEDLDIKPTAETEELLKNLTKIGEKNWLCSPNTLEYDVRYGSKLRYLKVTGDLPEGVVADVDKENRKVKVTIPKGYEGELKFTISAEDTTDTYADLTPVVNVDTKKPLCSGVTISGSKYEKYGNVYVKTNPTIKVNSSDNGTGVQEIKLSNGSVSSNGVFTVGTGSYTFEIVDKAGNSSGNLNLKDYSTVGTNSIVVDTEKPKIVCSRPEGSFNGWFNKDQMYVASLSDNEGIREAKITINGKEVNSFKCGDEVTKAYLLYASTADAVANEDGSYNIEVEVTDLAGNKETWSDTIKKDTTAPTIDKIVFTGGNLEGKLDLSTGDYGFYFKEATYCDVYVSDNGVSSGLSEVNVSYAPVGKDAYEKQYVITDGVARIEIPQDFKGKLSFNAFDNVDNISLEVVPDGVITESNTTFVNNTYITITTPGTNKVDANGISLYNSDQGLSATVVSNYAGIKTVEWGINDQTKGTVNISNNGTISGDSANVSKKDKNLVIDLSKGLGISENMNNIKVWVKVTDRAGYVSEASKTISIDKDVPIVNVSYNQTNSSSYYSTTRTASIHIKERNFDPSLVNISGKLGSLSGWSSTNGVDWYNTITFSSDGDYNLSVSCTDLAGNVGNTYVGEEFTIDKTNPSISVSFNNNTATNGNYYNTSRTATVTVTEHNFNPNSIHVDGANISGWSSSGDTHTANIAFVNDGKYKFSISGSDMAGNPMNTYSSEEFIIDTKEPEIKITGVSKGVSYKKDVHLEVNVSDDYIDASKSSVKLKGDINGEVKLNGSLSLKGGTISLDELKKVAKNDDIYTLTVKIVDMAGNTKEEEFKFSVNRFGSSYVSQNEELLNSYTNVAETVVLQESNVDKINLDNVEIVVLLNGNKVSIDSKYIKKEDKGIVNGKHLYQYSIDKDAFDKDGKYTIEVYSSSSDGTKYDNLSQEYSFVIDTQKPDIIISGIKDNGKYKEYEKEVTISVKDVSGLESVLITLNGKVVEAVQDGDLYTIKVPESDSRQVISVKAIDKAGNISENEVKDILITSNQWVYLINQLWFKIGAGVLSAGIILIIILIIARRIKKQAEVEKEMQEDLKDIYSSESNSNSSDSSNDAE